MLKFQLLRMLKDYIGHLILILMPIVLILFFSFVYKGEDIRMVEAKTYLTIGFALTFQIYGASFGYQCLGIDFYSPMRDRLNATPANPHKLIFTVLLTSSIVCLLQTLVILASSVLILKTTIDSILPILLVMILAIIVAQLLGAVVLLISNKVKTATSVMMLYAILTPFIAGVYFQLPEGLIFDIMTRYLTTLSLAQTAIYGIINANTTDILIGVLSLTSLAIIFLILLKPLSKRITV